MAKKFKLFLIFFIIVCSGIVFARYEVGYFGNEQILFRLDDVSFDGYAIDSSSQGRNGVFFNYGGGYNPWTYSKCAPISSNIGCLNCSVDSDAGIEWQNLSLLTQNKNWTVSVWVYSNILNANRYIITPMADGQTQIYWLSSNNFDIGLYDSADNYHGVQTGTILNWQHFAMTYNEQFNNFSIYRNGTIIYNEIVPTIQIGLSDGVNSICGHWKKATGNYAFSGMVDDFIIFDRTLTVSEIYQIWSDNYSIDKSPPNISVIFANLTNTNEWLNVSLTSSANCTINMTEFNLINHSAKTYNFLETSLSSGTYSVKIEF